MTRLQRLLAFMFVLVSLGLSWVLIKSLVDADPNTRAAIIAMIGAVVGGIYAHAQTQKREIKTRHFAEKKNAYMRFIDLFFKFTAYGRNKQKLSADEVEKAILDFKKELIIWGDQEVVKALAAFEQRSLVNPNAITQPENILFCLERILRAIRKDLGHDDSQLSCFLILPCQARLSGHFNLAMGATCFSMLIGAKKVQLF